MRINLLQLPAVYNEERMGKSKIELKDKS